MYLFIFKSSARGTHYGVGRYIVSLIQALLSFQDVHICEVCYHCHDCSCFYEEFVACNHIRLHIPDPVVSCIWDDAAEARYVEVIMFYLSAYVKNDEQTVFHLNSMNELFLARALKDRYAFPLVAVIHSACYQFLFETKPCHLQAIDIECPKDDVAYTLHSEKKFYETVHGIVSVTQYMRTFLQEEYHIGGKRIDVIHNSLDFHHHALDETSKSNLKASIGFGEKEKILLYVGRLDDSKGIAYLLEAFVALTSYSDWRLILAGEGDFQKYMPYAISQLGRVSFTGYLSQDTLRKLYAIADMGILPSLYDHSPYSLLEMVDYEIPLIVSDIPGPTEVFTGDICKLIPMEVSDGGLCRPVVNEMKRLLAEGFEDEAWRHAAHDRYRVLRDKFHISKMGEAYYRFYQRIMHEVPSST